MISAQEARERTATPEQIMTAELEFLDKEVTAAAANGMSTLTVRGAASPKTVEALQALGYTVAVRESETVVSW